jgi:hypothetical protein
MRAATSDGAGGTSPPLASACGIHCGHIGGGGNQSGIVDSSVIVIASFGVRKCRRKILRAGHAPRSNDTGEFA